MGVEAFAEIAGLLAPGWFVEAVENVHFHNPFKFYRMEPQTLYLQAAASLGVDGRWITHAELRSRRALANPELPPQEKVHFTAEVVLARKPLAPLQIVQTPAGSGWPEIGAEEIYGLYFHGPAFQVLEQVCLGEQEVVGIMKDSLPPLTVPADAFLLMAPRLLELCFQAAGIWEIKKKGRLALPLAIGSVRAFRPAELLPGKRLRALVRALEGGKEFAARVVDEDGCVYLSLEGYRTIALGD
jgi:hypothetical protein